MTIIFVQILAILLPALLEYLCWYVVKLYTKKDYSKTIMAIFILLIGFIPLIIVLFFQSNFETKFYKEFLGFSNDYLLHEIVGTILGYLFTKIIK